MPTGTTGSTGATGWKNNQFIDPFHQAKKREKKINARAHALKEKYTKFRIHAMPPKRFSSHQELIIAGWVIYRDLTRRNTTTSSLSSFIFRQFHVNVNPSWKNRFFERQHLSLQRPSNMTNSELSIELKERAVNFIKMIRALKLQPHQIVALDKTSFYGDSRFIRTISIKGSYDEFIHLLIYHF